MVDAIFIIACLIIATIAVVCTWIVVCREEDEAGDLNDDENLDLMTVGGWILDTMCKVYLCVAVFMMYYVVKLLLE